MCHKHYSMNKWHYDDIHEWNIYIYIYYNILYSPFYNARQREMKLKECLTHFSQYILCTKNLKIHILKICIITAVVTKKIIEPLNFANSYKKKEYSVAFITIWFHRIYSQFSPPEIVALKQLKLLHSTSIKINP